MPVRLCASSAQIWGQSGEFSRGLPFACGERLVTRHPTFVCPIQSCTETGLGRGEEKGVPRGEVLPRTPVCMSRGASSRIGCPFGRVHEMELGQRRWVVGESKKEKVCVMYL